MSRGRAILRKTPPAAQAILLRLALRAQGESVLQSVIRQHRSDPESLEIRRDLLRSFHHPPDRRMRCDDRDFPALQGQVFRRVVLAHPSHPPSGREVVGQEEKAWPLFVHPIRLRRGECRSSEGKSSDGPTVCHFQISPVRGPESFKRLTLRHGRLPGGSWGRGRLPGPRDSRTSEESPATRRS